MLMLSLWRTQYSSKLHIKPRVTLQNSTRLKHKYYNNISDLLLLHKSATAFAVETKSLISRLRLEATLLHFFLLLVLHNYLFTFAHTF